MSNITASLAPSRWGPWLKFAALNTLRNRRRSAVTVTIAALGTAAILLAGGFALSTYQALAQAAARTTGHLVIGQPAQFSSDEDTPLQHGLDDAAALQARLLADDAVRQVLPRVQFSGLISNGDKSVVMVATGIEPDAEFAVKGPFLKIGAGKVLVTSDAQVIREADRVVFPGVGAIRDCMAEIKRLGFDQLVREVSQDRPFLGICVGMQALLESSEENGGVDCIGMFPGQVRFFGKDLVEDGEKLKVPHMGWNEVEQVVQHPLWHEIPDRARFYFVHSYYVAAANARHVVGSGHYGNDFAAALAEGSRFAVQFHPEKSHTHGLQLLQNFASWDGRW